MPGDPLHVNQKGPPNTPHNALIDSKWKVFNLCYQWVLFLSS